MIEHFIQSNYIAYKENGIYTFCIGYDGYIDPKPHIRFYISGAYQYEFGGVIFYCGATG